MHRLVASLATCLVAGLTAGCGTATASNPGPAPHSTASAAPATSTVPATSTAPAAPAGARTASGCRGSAPAPAITLVITLAGNGKTYCVRVGGKLSVNLRSADASSWLPPLVSSGALVSVPGGANSLVKGLTAGSFAAVRPGQALVTSVRPPCEVKIPAMPAGKGDLEPADPVPQSYPLRLCAPGHRFSASVIVVRLSWYMAAAMPWRDDTPPSTVYSILNSRGRTLPGIHRRPPVSGQMPCHAV
jgi:hypothetical protein